MNMTEGKKKKTLWNFIDNLEGDKVVWMIVLLLILFSIVAIFSSTSQMTYHGGSRINIVGGQMLTAAAGLVVILLCYAIPKIGVFRYFSQLGYGVSLVLLIPTCIAQLTLGEKEIMNLGLFTVQKVNNACRAITIHGIDIQVLEVAKLAMVMYLAWAVNALRNDDFSIANRLAEKNPFWGKTWTKKIAYVYIPLCSVIALIYPNSNTSALFTAAIMAATIVVGGIKWKEILIPGGLVIAVIVVVGMTFNIGRFGTFKNRFGMIERNMSVMVESSPGSKEFRKALEAIKQPVSAKIAIKEGKIFGKGPGKSTQRYVTPIMYEDYMFSLIVEEYGLIGAIIVIALYISLLARGIIIVRNCNNHFAKTAVAGLVLLISCQGMMHIAINCDIMPHTGQTLPMISYGRSSFLMFSLAFGIILSISKMAKRKIDKETMEAEPLVKREAEVRDEVRSGMDDLDLMESGMPVHENDIPDYGLDDHNNE
jgi:cell division protein FtsW